MRIPSLRRRTRVAAAALAVLGAALVTGRPTGAGATTLPLPTVSLTASVTTVGTGQPVTLTATVSQAQGSPVPTGTVTFTTLPGATTLTAALDGSGVATTSWVAPPAGSYAVTAAYGGDAAYLPAASAAVHVTVLPPNPVSVFTWTDPSVPGQRVVVEAYVPTPSGQPAATGTVTFRDGGTVIGTDNLSAAGYASIYVPFTEGTHSITAAYSGDAVTQPGTSAAWSQSVGAASADLRFVDQLYNDLLDRVPDGGAAAWAALLDRGGATRIQVAQALVSSDEFVRDRIEEMYRAHLGRAADPGGLAYWLGYIQHGGGTYESLEVSFLGAHEYYVQAGGTNDGFLSALYLDVFGRDIDAGGRTYWDGRLASGTPQWVVAMSVVMSDEAMTNRVTDYYWSLLWRAPDAGGLAAWTTRLQSGVRDQDLMALLTSSAEYWNKTQAF